MAGAAGDRTVPMRRWVVGVVVGGLVLGAACSGGDGGDSGDSGDGGDGQSVVEAVSEGGGGAVDLMERLPASSPAAAYVDLDAAREQLGLPADADLDDIDLTGEPERARLLGVAALGLPHLAQPRDVPLTSALDTGQVHAAAATGSTSREYGVAVVRTDQSFDDLADALAQAGYEAEGELLVRGGPALQVVFPVVADGGDGTIVLATSEEAARAVLDGDPRSSPAVELLDQVPGIAAAAVVPSSGLECGAVGVGVDLEPATGEIVIFAGDDPDPAQAVPDPDALPALRQAELGEPQVDGDHVRIELEYETDVPLVNPTRLAASDITAEDVYRC